MRLIKDFLMYENVTGCNKQYKIKILMLCSNCVGTICTKITKQNTAKVPTYSHARLHPDYCTLKKIKTLLLNNDMV